MKFAGLILLMSLIITQTFGPHLMTMAFRMNQREIADKYCVNKARPQMKCKGQCFLAKKLAKMNQSDTEQEKPGELSINLKSHPFTTHQVAGLIITGTDLPVNSWGIATNEWIPDTYPQSVFHPPSFSA